MSETVIVGWSGGRSLLRCLAGALLVVVVASCAVGQSPQSPPEWAAPVAQEFSVRLVMVSRIGGAAQEGMIVERNSGRVLDARLAEKECNVENGTVKAAFAIGGYEVRRIKLWRSGNNAADWKVDVSLETDFGAFQCAVLRGGAALSLEETVMRGDLDIKVLGYPGLGVLMERWRFTMKVSPAMFPEGLES